MPMGTIEKISRDHDRDQKENRYYQRHELSHDRDEQHHKPHQKRRDHFEVRDNFEVHERGNLRAF